MRFSVLAVHYDGTIAKGEILDYEVRTAVAQVRAQGITFVIVSGRILSDLKKAAGDLGFIDAVVAGNVALFTAVLFFVTLLLHELSHSLAAEARGLKVTEITLFALGGVSQIQDDATDAKTEFWVAIAGPIASLVIGFACLAIAVGLGWQRSAEPRTGATAVLVWLGYINVGLAVFNMIPGFPLDGGRVLRSIVWAITKNADGSTRIAARVGQVAAFLFILDGIWRFFAGAGFGGLWIAFIGWFLMEAAKASYAQVEITAAFRGMQVSGVCRHSNEFASAMNINKCRFKPFLRRNAPSRIQHRF